MSIYVVLYCLYFGELIIVNGIFDNMWYECYDLDQNMNVYNVYFNEYI